MRATGAVVLATVVALLVPTTAQASETRRISTKKDLSTAGYALTAATVSFPSRKAFDVHGWVKDACGGEPAGDGRGAYVEVVFRTPSGAQRHQRIGKDANGCDNGRRHYDPAPKKFDGPIKSVTILACEIDVDDPDEMEACSLRLFDNWRVD